MALFIGNVDRKVLARDIYEEFHRYGDILDITMHDNYVFLSYRHKKSAESAIESLNEKPFFGKTLNVKMRSLRNGCVSCGSRDHLSRYCPTIEPPPKSWVPFSGRYQNDDRDRRRYQNDDKDHRRDDDRDHRHYQDDDRDTFRKNDYHKNDDDSDHPFERNRNFRRNRDDEPNDDWSKGRGRDYSANRDEGRISPRERRIDDGIKGRTGERENVEKDSGVKEIRREDSVGSCRGIGGSERRIRELEEDLNRLKEENLRLRNEIEILRSEGRGRGGEERVYERDKQDGGREKRREWEREREGERERERERERGGRDYDGRGWSKENTYERGRDGDGDRKRGGGRDRNERGALVYGSRISHRRDRVDDSPSVSPPPRGYSPRSPRRMEDGEVNVKRRPSSLSPEGGGSGDVSYHSHSKFSQ